MHESHGVHHLSYPLLEHQLVKLLVFLSFFAQTDLQVPERVVVHNNAHKERPLLPVPRDEEFPEHRACGYLWRDGMVISVGWLFWPCGAEY